MNISVASVLPDFASTLRGLDNGLKTLDTNLRQANTAADARKLGDVFIERTDSAIKSLTEQVRAVTPEMLHSDAYTGERLYRDLTVKAAAVSDHLDSASFYTARATEGPTVAYNLLDVAKLKLANAFEAADVKPMTTAGHIGSGADDAARTSGHTPHYGNDGIDELGNASRNDRGHVGNDGQGYTDAGEATGAYAHDDYSGIVLY